MNENEKSYDGVKLIGSENYDGEWLPAIKQFLSSRGLQRCIEPGWSPTKPTFAARPTLAPSPPAIPAPVVRDAQGIALDADTIAAVKVEYDVEVAARNQIIADNKQLYDEQIIAYNAEKATIAKDLLDMNKTVYNINQSLSQSIKNSNSATVDPVILWSDLSARHSTIHHTIHEKLESQWNEFSINIDESIESMLNRLEALRIKIRATTITIANDDSVSKLKLINGLDYRFIAAAQVLITQNDSSVTLDSLIATLLKIGETTNIVGNRNLNKKANNRSENTGIQFSQSEIKKLKNALRVAELNESTTAKLSITSKKLSDNGKENGKRNTGKQKTPISKRDHSGSSADESKPIIKKLQFSPYPFCGNCGTKHKHGCKRGKGCDCHKCDGKPTAKVTQINSKNKEFSLDDLSFTGVNDD